jgi:signal transduction histidine kinase
MLLELAAEDFAARVNAALQNARMYAVAQDATQARDDFLVLVAHELRTPLTALQLWTDGLLRRARRDGDAEETQRSDAISREVRRFIDVVEHVIEASTIRAEGVKLARTSCDIAQIVRGYIAQVAERARRAGTPITVHAASPIVGLFDCAGVERIVRVLVDNAIKFGEKKPIEVSLHRDGADAELTVVDRGVGADPDHLPALFFAVRAGRGPRSISPVSGWDSSSRRPSSRHTAGRSPRKAPSAKGRRSSCGWPFAGVTQS